MINWREHITSDPKVMLGKPCLKGTRIPVDLVLEELAHGRATEDLLKGYPALSDASINACLMFAAENLRDVTIFPEAS